MVCDFTVTWLYMRWQRQPTCNKRTNRIDKMVRLVKSNAAFIGLKLNENCRVILWGDYWRIFASVCHFIHTQLGRIINSGFLSVKSAKLHLMSSNIKKQTLTIEQAAKQWKMTIIYPKCHAIKKLTCSCSGRSFAGYVQWRVMYSSFLFS